MPRLTLDTFYVHTKYGDSGFSRSGDDCGCRNLKWATPFLGVVYHQKTKLNFTGKTAKSLSARALLSLI